MNTEMLVLQSSHTYIINTVIRSGYCSLWDEHDDQ